MYIEEKVSSSLAKFLNQFNLTILDTCSLMDVGFTKFAENLSNGKEYFKKENQIIVLHSCIKELKKHSKDKENDYKRVDAIRALKILKQLKHDRVIKIKYVIGNKNFADNVIYTYSSTNRISKTILVITQDKYLCQDLRILNQSLSQGGKPISIYRISPFGSLEQNRGRPDLVLKQNQPIRKQSLGSQPKVKIERKQILNRPVKRPRKVKLDKKLIDEILINDSKLTKDLKNASIKRFAKIEEIHDQLDRFSKLGESNLAEIKISNSKLKLETTLKELESVKLVNEVKSAKKSAVKKVEAPKIEKKKEVKTSTSLLDDLKIREVRLMANMSNPTYPTSAKRADLEKFKEDFKKLKASEKSQLKLNLTKINAVLKTLK